VVVIDIPKGVIEKKIPVPGATGLNDITVDEKGVVYVSDSKSGKIYRIAGDTPALYKISGPSAPSPMAAMAWNWSVTAT